MAPNGRPPVPNEVKRRRGTARPDRTPALSEVTILPQADGVPDPPAGLGESGLELWRQAWQAGITWIAPTSDFAQVAEACRLADDVAVARERFRVTHEPADARALATLSKLLTEALTALGFNPVARTRLGVAEVKARSELERILASREARRGEAAAGE